MPSELREVALELRVDQLEAAIREHRAGSKPIERSDRDRRLYAILPEVTAG